MINSIQIGIGLCMIIAGLFGSFIFGKTSFLVSIIGIGCIVMSF